MKNYLAHCSTSDIKRIQKKLKENGREIRNERPKKFFLSAEYITQEDVFEYLQEENRYTLQRIKEEKERAWKFLTNKENDIKYGWVSEDPKKHPKQSQEQLDEWTALAYPNINVQAFELEFELKTLEEALND